jgi:hypothetical protein
MMRPFDFAVLSHNVIQADFFYVFKIHYRS